MLYGIIPLQFMVISTQPGSAIFFGFCQQVPWFGTNGKNGKNVMRENNSFSQYCHFLCNKFFSNDKSSSINSFKSCITRSAAIDDKGEPSHRNAKR